MKEYAALILTAIAFIIVTVLDNMHNQPSVSQYSLASGHDTFGLRQNSRTSSLN
jgi:hypothetical protein